MNCVTHSLEPYFGPSLTFPQEGPHKLPGMWKVSPPLGLLQGAEQKGVSQFSWLLGCLKSQRESWVLFSTLSIQPQLPECLDQGYITVSSLSGSVAPGTILM